MRDRDTFFLYEKFRPSQWTPGIPKPNAYLEKPPEADELIQLVKSLTAEGERKKDYVESLFRI